MNELFEEYELGNGRGGGRGWGVWCGRCSSLSHRAGVRRDVG